MRTCAGNRLVIRLHVLALRACGLLIAIGGCTPAYSPPAASPAHSLALIITGASVVDLTTGAAAPATIMVENGRITRVAPPGDIAAPTAAIRVDATGAYVIPGLWDMHAHTTYATAREVEQAFFGPLIAHGIVAIRDPASRFSMEQIRRWRAAIEAGALIGPSIAAVGRVVDARPITLGTVLARDTAEARRAVDFVKAEGYEFVKPYNDLTLDTYLVLAAHARRLNIPIAGHLPYGVDAITAAEAGQRSIEHLTNLWFETATAEEQIRERITSGVTRGEPPVDLFRAKIDSLFPLAFETHSVEKERDLLEAFVRHRTWQTPTLVVDRYYLRCGAAAPVAGDSAAQRLTPRWLRASGRSLDSFFAALTPEQCSTLATLYHREAALVGRMQRAGVGLLAGTDAPQAFLAPGASLHDELEALVSDAGLTPLEALRSATVNPAQFFGATDSTGAVRPGYRADFLLLDANPALDIANVRGIRALVLGGRFLDRRVLDGLLQAAERAATR